jgi:outer membrane protein OmpA-like peptidoglycan-associated protein
VINVLPQKPRVRVIVNHFRIFPLALSLLVAVGSLPGCNKRDAGNTDKAELAPGKEALKRSYEELKPKLEQQKTLLAGLRKQMDRLPSDEQLPGLVPLRAKLHSIEEVLGVTDAKVAWLSGELDTATSAGKSEELLKASKQVSQTESELNEISRAAVELTHQLGPFERTAALMINPATAFSRVLPTGYKVVGAEGGLEQTLLDFIADSKKVIDKDTWFMLDHVFFVKEAELDGPGSKPQLDNVLEIFKAYPTLKLKIGGFTDNALSAAASKKLSTERALAVKNALVTRGVPAARLESQGYGQAQPVCAANDTEECKAKNRRTSVNVTAK